MLRDSLVVRRAEARDLPRVAELAGALVRMHHEADPARFMLIDDVEAGYAAWFAREHHHDRAVILVACSGAFLAGYAYGRLESRDWNMLLDEHGAVHDIFVAPEARGQGIGRALMTAIVRALDGMGAKRIVLSTMVANESAQRMFRACGFRPTMLEMTRDAGREPKRGAD